MELQADDRSRMRPGRSGIALMGALLAVLVLSVAAASSAGTGTLSLISTSSAGVKANLGVFPLFSMADDGSRVAFRSSSTNLISPAPSADQIYVKDVASGVLTLASATAAGVAANGFSDHPQISRNGRFVTFNSAATNLDPADTDADPDVYLKDLVTGSLTLVSTSAAGVNGNGPNLGPAPVSDDGRTIVFASRSGNFDPRHTTKTCTANPPGRPPFTFDCSEVEAYKKDVVSGALSLLTPGDNGLSSVDPSAGNFAALSADGSKIALASYDPLAAADADSASPDAFVLNPTGPAILASTQLAAGTADASTTQISSVSMSADGNRVGLQAHGSDWNACPPCMQVYVKDLPADTLTLVSRRADGVEANDQSQHVQLSSDGTYASFASFATNLDPSDPDDISDVYLKNLDTGELTLVSVRDDGVRGDNASIVSAPVGDGQAVLFASIARNLDPADPDGWDDLYLKRFPTVPVDANADGIVDSLQPAGTPVGSFYDVSTSPPTSGSIVNANGLTVTIADAPDLVDGVLISVGSGTGTQRATISACGLTHRIYHDSVAVITCGSSIVETHAGLGEIELDGGLAIVSIPSPASAEVTDTPNGALIEDVSGGSVTVTVDGVPTVIAAGSPARAVNSWDFTGFGPPVDNSTSDLIVLNKAKAGRAIPLKWHLDNATGQPVTTLSAATITVENFPCGLGDTVDDIEQTFAGGSGLQNLGGGDYQLNWKTNSAWAGSCKVMHLDLGDGIKHYAHFKFNK